MEETNLSAARVNPSNQKGEVWQNRRPLRHQDGRNKSSEQSGEDTKDKSSDWSSEREEESAEEKYKKKKGRKRKQSSSSFK